MDMFLLQGWGDCFHTLNGVKYVFMHRCQTFLINVIKTLFS